MTRDEFLDKVHRAGVSPEDCEELEKDLDQLLQIVEDQSFEAGREASVHASECFRSGDGFEYRDIEQWRALRP